MLKLSDQITGTIYIFISAFMYGTMAILAKFAYMEGLAPSNTIFYRYFFAFIILCFYQIISRKGPVISTSPIAIVQGVLLIVGSLFYFYSLQHLSAGIGNVIFFTHPVLVALLAVFIYREPLNIKIGSGLILAMAGITLISGLFYGSVSAEPVGLVLAVVASICYAFYVLFSQANVIHSSPISLTATFSLIGIVIVPPLFFRDFDFVTTLTFNQAVICLAMALFNTVLSIIFFLKGVQKIGSSRSAIISTLEPVLTIILAMILLHETFSFLEAAGAILIIISMFLAVTAHSPVHNEPDQLKNTG